MSDSSYISLSSSDTERVTNTRVAIQRKRGMGNRTVTISPVPTLIVFFAVLLIGAGALTLATGIFGVPFAASISLLAAGTLIICALALTTILCSAFPPPNCHAFKKAFEI